MAINEIECSWLDPRSVITFFVAEKCKHMKFINECGMCYQKLVLAKEKFINGLNIGLPVGL